MRYSVFLQNSKKEKGYLAWVPALPMCVSEGHTREEALEKVQNRVKEILTDIVEITQVEVDIPQMSHKESDPWLEFRGMFADDPDFEDVLKEIEAYRQELDRG
jgi:predicted RNase H-like HicB family nuclease